MGYNIAVCGATGNVGREMLNILAERLFPVDELTALASRRSLGTECSFGDKVLKTKDLDTFDFKGIDIALFAVGSEATKKYVKKQFNNVLELVSFEGNVTLKDGSAFAHAHVVLSDHEMRTLGGHLFETTVAAVGELFIRKFEGDAYRKMNDDIGLPCICLENNF